MENWFILNNGILQGDFIIFNQCVEDGFGCDSSFSVAFPELGFGKKFRTTFIVGGMRASARTLFRRGCGQGISGVGFKLKSLWLPLQPTHLGIM